MTWVGFRGRGAAIAGRRQYPKMLQRQLGSFLTPKALGFKRFLRLACGTQAGAASYTDNSSFTLLI